jgi:hypothetical protein
MSRLYDFLKTKELNIGHLVIGFLLSTLLSVVIGQFLNHYTLIENQKLDEVNKFVASSEQFDDAMRDYVHTIIVKSDDQEKSKEALIGDIERQYGDLQVAKLYLHHNGQVAADDYSRSLVKLTSDLRNVNSAADTGELMNELNRTLQLRKLVEISLRKSAGLPTESESQGDA